LQEDKLFTRKIAKKFEFDQSVAAVFDDMLSRSVPFYDEVRQLIITLILKEAKEGMQVLDLGRGDAGARSWRFYCKVFA